MTVLVVALGGAAGATARYAVSLAAHRWGGHQAWGTLSVNLLGCFAVGLLLSWLDTRLSPDTALRAGLITGFLGAFTTFSAFGKDALDLIRQGSTPMAVLYIAGSVGIGLLAVVAGMALGSRA